MPRRDADASEEDQHCGEESRSKSRHTQGNKVPIGLVFPRKAEEGVADIGEHHIIGVKRISTKPKSRIIRLKIDPVRIRDDLRPTVADAENDNVTVIANCPPKRRRKEQQERDRQRRGKVRDPAQPASSMLEISGHENSF